MNESRTPETAPQAVTSLLVLEIGTEEIPARFLTETLAHLKENASRIFSEYRVSFPSLKTYATPRRLALVAEVDTLQSAAEKEVWGPPVNVAFDSSGNPTKAADAFARTQGVAVGDLLRKEKGKGSYVVALIKETASPTAVILPEVLQKLILSLHFPKTMRWGDGQLRFARPIHWILALYHNERIKFEIDGIKSGTSTRGHRFLSPAAFEVKDAKTYMNLLRNNFVYLDPDERKRVILEGARHLASSVNSFLMEDDELLEHVSYLVEYPAPVLGTFSSVHLALPKELLITVMKDHQKYFAVKNSLDNLTNYFIVISNTKQDNAETIRKGAEKVLKARFEDARFYFEQDKKVPSNTRLEALRKVIFHDRLGTLYDKTLRIASIADYLAESSHVEKKEEVHTAALLSKTDLISGVVREFPELQGIMGGYYALHDGYGADIVTALSEQYLPGRAGDRLPQTNSGAILSLSDKLDNLASSFMLGMTPTGAEDPFALRRQAFGSILILNDRRYKVTLLDLLTKALEPFALKEGDSVLNDLITFFEQRLESLLLSQGYPADALSAVLYLARENPIYTILERLDALQKFKADPYSTPFLLAVKRINNISPKIALPPVRSELLMQDEERVLHQKVDSLTPLMPSLLADHKYYEAIEVFQTLIEPINAFFDKVLVMDKQEEVKQNRLSLIKSIQRLALQIADFSKLSLP